MGEAKRCTLGVGDIGFFFVTNTGQLLLIKWAQLAWIATLKFMYVIQFPQKYIRTVQNCRVSNNLQLPPHDGRFELLRKNLNNLQSEQRSPTLPNFILSPQRPHFSLLRMVFCSRSWLLVSLLCSWGSGTLLVILVSKSSWNPTLFDLVLFVCSSTSPLEFSPQSAIVICSSSSILLSNKWGGLQLLLLGIPLAIDNLPAWAATKQL